MSAVVLVTGRLVRDPEIKVSGKGNDYVTASIREGEGAFWRLTAFGTDVRAELANLHSGDSLSVVGPLRAEVYAPEGKEPRVSLSLTVDRVLALRPRKRERSDRPRESRHADQRRSNAPSLSESPQAPPGWERGDIGR